MVGCNKGIRTLIDAEYAIGGFVGFLLLRLVM